MNFIHSQQDKIKTRKIIRYNIVRDIILFKRSKADINLYYHAEPTAKSRKKLKTVKNDISYINFFVVFAK